jgi:hypothetical protein
MPEWLMGADCKSAGYAYAGSNPARPIHNCPCGSVVEHTLGKGEVMSSILITGFCNSFVSFLFLNGFKELFKFMDLASN